MHLWKPWRKVICQATLETYGFLSQRPCITHGDICQTMGWYIITLEQLSKRKRDMLMDKKLPLNFLNGHAIDRDYLIVSDGKVVSPSYSYAFNG
jgi:hypothetical protein